MVVFKRLKPEYGFNVYKITAQEPRKQLDACFIISKQFYRVSCSDCPEYQSGARVLYLRGGTRSLDDRPIRVPIDAVEDVERLMKLVGTFASEELTLEEA